MARQRRGMVVKNTDTKAVHIEMSTRAIKLAPGEEKMVTADEVLDSTLRQFLQVRAVSIVRPVTEEEELLLREQLGAAT